MPTKPFRGRCLIRACGNILDLIHMNLTNKLKPFVLVQCRCIYIYMYSMQKSHATLYRNESQYPISQRLNELEVMDSQMLCLQACFLAPFISIYYIYTLVYVYIYTQIHSSGMGLVREHIVIYIYIHIFFYVFASILTLPTSPADVSTEMCSDASRVE